MRHIFAVSKSDTNMHEAKSRKKTEETMLRRRDVAALVAEIHGVTADHVRKVVRGDRENEQILATYMQIVENDNMLLRAAKDVVPFKSNLNPEA
jgi:hypothetical protein